MSKPFHLLLVGALFSVGTVLAGVGCGDDSSGGSGGTGGGTGGAGGGTTTTTTTAGGGGMGGGSSNLTCTAYCEAIQAACSGANGQYSNMESCMGACEGTFPVGTEADMGGNTLGCRTYHAGAAMADPVTHCPHAGPSGASVCGTIQQGFCSIAPVVCPNIYADNAACMTDTMAIDVTTPYSVAEVAGDTLACRLYHLQVAAESDANAMVHCPHIDSMNDAMDPCQ